MHVPAEQAAFWLTGRMELEPSLGWVEDNLDAAYVAFDTHQNLARRALAGPPKVSETAREALRWLRRAMYLKEQEPPELPPDLAGP